jgi:two-component system, response regulator RegA
MGRARRQRLQDGGDHPYLTLEAGRLIAGLEVPMSEGLFMVVDDDRAFRERLARALRSRGHLVREADGRAAAVRLALEEAPEYAVVDLRMADGSGLEVVSALLEIEPATRAVVLTGYGSIASAVEALKRGAVNYLTKPADAEEVLQALGLSSGEPAGAGAGERTPSLQRVEWEHINRVLHDCDGNISAAARALRLHRRSLQRKLQRIPDP